MEVHVDIETSGNAIDILAANCPLSKQKLKQAMSKGAVWLAAKGKPQRLRRAGKTVQPGQTLHLYYDVDVLAQVPAPAILIEDCKDYSVWHKPGGMLSQGSKWSDHCTITRWAEQNLQPQRNAFLIHRLDRAASGLILVGHSKGVTAQLCDLFQKRKLDKRYLVIVHGEFAADLTLDAPVEDKPAVSHATLKHYDEAQNRSLVEIKIETGRKHQIRRHMAGCGHPVVGDRMYGVGDESEDLQLTAFSLSFECPVRKTSVEFVLPEALWPALVGAQGSLAD
jgi:tRNA pseudouridine32 synthase/23S rRNA pseudouridine746 synthase